MRTSISTAASAAITLVRVPPRITPGLTESPLLQIVQLRDGDDLAGEFEDGAVSLAGIESGVRGNAFHVQDVFADAFARGLYGTASGGGFEHENGGGFSGQALR